MAKLSVDDIEDEKIVTLTIKLPVAIHRELVAYSQVLERESGRSVEPTSLIAPMLKRFMATDRAFKTSRRRAKSSKTVKDVAEAI
jgi:hypothetical protein